MAKSDNQNNEINSTSYEFNSYYNRSANSLNFIGTNLFDELSQKLLKQIVQDPMMYNEELRHLSLKIYGSNGVCRNTVDYMVAMPTLSKVVVTHGKSNNKNTFNKNLMESTLHTIKDAEIIRDALFKGMVEGVAFYYFETNERPNSKKKLLTDFEAGNIVEINSGGVNASIISLPADYTQIVGIKNSSYVLAFNLDYFDLATGEPVESKLLKYPSEIRDGYNKYKKQGIKHGNWLILDNTKTIVHKICSKREEKWGRPITLAALTDVFYSEYFTNTKRNVLDEINNKIVYQTFPEGKEKGTSALTRAQQEEQHKNVKSAVMSKNNRGGTSFFSVAAGTKIDTVDPSNTDIFDSKNEANLNDKISLDLGIAGSLLNGVGSGSYSAQQQNLELITSQIYQWVEQISAEINKCISYNIIKDNKNWVEVKYLPITHVNKSQMVSDAKDLYLQGKGSLTLWASACGIEPEVFYALLDQELEDDIENKYPVHKTSYVMSSKDGNSDSKAGRPKSNNPTENTIKSRNNNGNNIPTPSDK